jgi:hypothetical protein
VKGSLTAHQYVDRGQLFINPIGKLIVEMPYPRQSMKQPKPYSVLVGGKTVEPEPQHRMDRAAKPDRLYQEVRDDLARYAPIEVTRAAMQLRDHAYAGVIDSDGVPFRFVLNSRGLKITPIEEAGHSAAFLEFDDLMEAEQRRALDRRRVEAAREQARISKETAVPHPNLVVVEKSTAGERYAAEMRAEGAELAAQCGEEDLDQPRSEDALVVVEKARRTRRVERTGPDAWRFKKALPKKSKDKPVKKTPSKKSSTKKVGAKGNTRYGYPQEKGSPPAQAAPANPVKVPREPEGDPEVDPTEFANHFGLSVDTMRRVASRFATNEKLNGREGFVSFMKREMAQAAKKHRLDGDFWGLLFDGLMAPTSAPEQ